MRISDWSSDVCSSDLPGRPNRVLLLTFPLIFDGSVTGIFGTLSVGGTLVLPQALEASDPDRLARLIARAGVTQTIMIPSQWSLMLSSSRSEEPTSELQSLMRISYAVFCLKKKNNIPITNIL